MNPKLYLITAPLWLGGINNLTASATPLMRAVRDGDLETVEQLAAQEDIEATDEWDNTALHYAAKYDKVGALNVLLKANPKAKIEAKNNKGNTALHFAARYGYKEATEVLLKEKADIEAKSKKEVTALHYAAWQGHVGVVGVLLEAVPSAKIESKNDKKNTPLHLAAREGHVNVIKVLLGKGAKIEAQTLQGNTPLHLAAMRGHAGAVEELLMWGADVEAQNGEGKTARTLGGGRMAEFITGVLEKIKEENKSQEKDAAETKVEEKERAVAQQVAVGGIRQIVTTKKNEPDNDEGVGQQVVKDQAKQKRQVTEEEQSSPNFFSRLTSRGVVVGLLLGVLVLLILFYVRVHYWRPQPATKSF